MELLLEVEVHLTGAEKVRGKNREIVMLPFTGTTRSKYFQGQVVGTGADTQKIAPDSFSLSARYLLEGVDFTGEKCRIFVENNGSALDDLYPVVVTDSKALHFLEDEDLISEVTPTEDCVWVRIYRREKETE